MLIFLHGNAGNHKVMAWAWKPFADKYKIAIICPTFGFGFWDDGGVEAVERVYQHAMSAQSIDPARVWLGGISDGGKGVTRSATAYPEHYRGLIYLSPTMILAEVGSASFLDCWKGRHILVFQGEADHSVLLRDVDPAIALMRAGGIAVSYHTFPGEDHFLFFARRVEIFDQIAIELEISPR
jgi:pimeloyl-ACP methyl ester carboxylesterase